MYVRRLAVVALALAGMLAQAQDSFEAATIKPSKPGTRGYGIQPLAGRLKAQNVTLKQLIGEAYHVYDFQVAGGPKWVDEDRFDLEAKASDESKPTNKQLRAMLQKLLAERFNLTIHHDSKELPVYVLEVAKGGPKFKKSEDTEGQPYFRVFQRRQITAERAPLEYLMETLSVLLGRPAVDKTGLEGLYDYKLEWTPDAVQVNSDENKNATDDTNPTLAVALQEQMGLKFTSQKAPVDIITIDRAEKPSAN